MTWNITKPNTAQFIVNFLSSTGVSVTPSSAQVTLTYLVNNVATTSIVPLTLSGGYWTGTWDSSPADLGIANWVAASSLSSLGASGTLDVIDP